MLPSSPHQSFAAMLPISARTAIRMPLQPTEAQRVGSSQRWTQHMGTYGGLSDPAHAAPSGQTQHACHAKGQSVQQQEPTNGRSHAHCADLSGGPIRAVVICKRCKSTRSNLRSQESSGPHLPCTGTSSYFLGLDHRGISSCLVRMPHRSWRSFPPCTSS